MLQAFGRRLEHAARFAACLGSVSRRMPTFVGCGILYPVAQFRVRLGIPRWEAQALFGVSLLGANLCACLSAPVWAGGNRVKKGGSMRLYYEVALRSFRRATAYRTAYIAGLLTNAFFGAVRSFVYIALYRAGGNVAGFTLEDAISYTWVTQSLISIGAGWLSWDLAGQIRTGTVVTDLSRPWNFYGYWLSQSLGERAFNLLVRGSLTYLIGILYFSAHLPSVHELLAFAVAVSLAMLASFAFSFMINSVAFWLLDVSGVFLIANIVLGFLSGFMLPIAFFPPSLAAVARVLPFQAMSGLPAQVLLGQITGAELVQTLLLQAFWVVVLTSMALLVLRAAVRKVVIQGG